jgi:hypothetical protein
MPGPQAPLDSKIKIPPRLPRSWSARQIMAGSLVGKARGQDLTSTFKSTEPCISTSESNKTGRLLSSVPQARDSPCRSPLTPSPASSGVYPSHLDSLAMRGISSALLHGRSSRNAQVFMLAAVHRVGSCPCLTVSERLDPSLADPVPCGSTRFGHPVSLHISLCSRLLVPCLKLTNPGS